MAEMKASILSISPDAVIVDISHQIEKFNIRMGAYVLTSASPHFPKGTIHVAVVDPGVGTQRRSLLVQTNRGFFVGPDNGILLLAAEKQGVTSICEITNTKLMMPHVSCTFHGRDIFAPTAAHLAKEVSPSEFGPEIREVVKPDFAKVKRVKGTLTGEVLYVDGFGNIITNISEEEIASLHAEGTFQVDLLTCKDTLKFGNTYSEAKPKEAIVLIGSHGYIEIAMNQGNAAEKFHVKPGHEILLSCISNEP